MIHYFCKPRKHDTQMNTYYWRYCKSMYSKRRQISCHGQFSRGVQWNTKVRISICLYLSVCGMNGTLTYTYFAVYAMRLHLINLRNR